MARITRLAYIHSRIGDYFSNREEGLSYSPNLGVDARIHLSLGFFQNYIIWYLGWNLFKLKGHMILIVVKITSQTGFFSCSRKKIPLNQNWVTFVSCASGITYAHFMVLCYTRDTLNIFKILHYLKAKNCPYSHLFLTWKRLKSL